MRSTIIAIVHLDKLIIQSLHFLISQYHFCLILVFRIIRVGVYSSCQLKIGFSCSQNRFDLIQFPCFDNILIAFLIDLPHLPSQFQQLCAHSPDVVKPFFTVDFFVSYLLLENSQYFDIALFEVYAVLGQFYYFHNLVLIVQISSLILL